MTPTRRKPEKKTKSEKSIGATGALSSNDVQAGSVAPSIAGKEAPAKPVVPPVVTPAKSVEVTASPAAASEAPASVAAAGVPAASAAAVGKADASAPAVGKADAGEEKAGEEKGPKRSKVKAGAGSKKMSILLAVLAVFVVVLAGAFAWYRWLYGNDALNIQGTWYVNASEATIVIGEKEIALSDDVTYEYAIDSSDKSITYSFHDLSGVGHYRFSLDRGELAIIDGECRGFDSISSDLGWLVNALFCKMKGEEALPAEGDHVMLLTRDPMKVFDKNANDRFAADEAEPEPGEGSADGAKAEPSEGGADAKADNA